MSQRILRPVRAQLGAVPVVINPSLHAYRTYASGASAIRCKPLTQIRLNRDEAATRGLRL